MENNNNEIQENWKTQTYLLGSFGGLILGFLAAYLFARAAEEDAPPGIIQPGTGQGLGITVPQGRKPTPIKTTGLISLSLGVLSLLRQIAELGKDPKK